MALPDSVESYWRRQQALTATTVAIVVRAWRLSGGDPDRWAATLQLVLATLTRAQASAVVAAAAYVETALEEQSITAPPVAAIDPAPLVGVTGAGLTLGALYSGLPIQFGLHAARISAQQGEQSNRLQPLNIRDISPEVFQVAMDATAKQVEASVQTVLSDTGRAAESLEIAVRPGVGYVRMLNPPSCQRCVVQAGKFFRWNAGFERHPRCDCRHVPTNHASSDDMRVDPDKYFRSITTEEQDAAFGKGGAQAIRDGANLGQVVNARKGMSTAQVYGQRLRVTTSGRRRNFGPKLMPESIYKIAENRDDALRLLRTHGYIDDAGIGVVDLDAILARA